MNTEGTRSTIERNLRRARAVGLDDNLLTTARGEEPAERVVNVGRALNDSSRGKKSASPAEFGTSDGLEPSGGLWYGLADDVARSVARQTMVMPP